MLAISEQRKQQPLERLLLLDDATIGTIKRKIVSRDAQHQDTIEIFSRNAARIDGINRIPCLA